MNTYFSDFYNVLFPHLTGYSVEDFYGCVFSWYLGDQSSGDNLLDKSLLERWVGERGVPRRILLQAMNYPNTAAEQYDTVFSALDNRIRVVSPESYDMLSNSLTALTDSLPLNIPFNYNYTQMTMAFTTSLICDGISSWERLIEAGLRASVGKVLATCKKKNNTFSTMYILGILLNSPYRLLGHMLEKCVSAADNGADSKNLKSRWEAKTAAYAGKVDHKDYLPVTLNDIEIFQQAKLVAFSYNNKIRIAGELEVCKAIVRCPDDSSSSIRALKADLGEMADPVKWDKLADKCYETMYRTSI